MMTQAEPNDIVITGIGILSPIGIGVDAFRAGLAAGVPGFRRTELLDFIAAPDCIGGEVTEFTASTAKKNYLRPLRKSVKLMCREIQLGVAAALMGMEHAGLNSGDYESERAGVSYGANLMSNPPQVLAGGVRNCLNGESFHFSQWGSEGMRGMEPLWLLCYLPNMPGCHIGIALDARGPNNSLTHDEASGGLAIAEACGALQRSRADVMLVGVTGTRLHNVKAAQAVKWDVLATGPAESRCRPLDAGRTGEVVAESACTLVLERRQHAEARGANILGQIVSTGTACIIAADGTADEQAAVERAASNALRKAGLTADQIGHINVCASGHPQRDLYEATAIQNLLGDAVDSVPVTAPKSYLGSATSGSSLAEIAASLLTLQDSEVIRTLNCDEVDPTLNLDVVTGSNRATENRTFLKTSVTRMGQATAVVIRA